MITKCSSCPSQRCRYYLRGRRCVLDIEHGREHTHVAIAAAVGLSERHVQRVEQQSLAKLRALPASVLGELRALLDLDRDFLSTEDPSFFGPHVRLLRTLAQSGDMPRATALTSTTEKRSSVERRAGLLFSGDHMPMPKPFSVPFVTLGYDPGTRLPGQPLTFSATPSAAPVRPPAPGGTPQGNPYLAAFMRAAGITIKDIEEHGPSSITVVSNLRELAADTASRK